MKKLKTSLVAALLLSSFFSSTWALNHRCPTAAAIIHEISGKEPSQLWMDTDKGTKKYAGVWGSRNFGDIYTWGFCINNVNAQDYEEALIKMNESLVTLSGNPEPEMTQFGPKCTYNIGSGYTAFVAQIVVIE